MIVGVTGKKQHGKGEIAKILVEKGFKEVQFSTLLKQAVYILNPLVVIEKDSEYFDLVTNDLCVVNADDDFTVVRLKNFIDLVGWEEAKKTAEVRRILQYMGTEVGRKMFGENFWVDKTLENLPEGDVVISDVRFDNEAESVSRLGGVNIEVVRPGFESTDTHESEKGISQHLKTYSVLNNGTLEDLKNCIEELDLI